MTKVCTYSRDSDIEQYEPQCCTDEDECHTSVHPEDCLDSWIFCPFCGKTIEYTDED